MPGGLRLNIRLTPKAGRDDITGVKPTADGTLELCASVTAAPEKGRANEALLRLLAKSLNRPLRDLELVAGATDRHKQVLVAGDTTVLKGELTAWLAGLEDKKRVP